MIDTQGGKAIVLGQNYVPSTPVNTVYGGKYDGAIVCGNCGDQVVLGSGR